MSPENLVLDDSQLSPQDLQDLKMTSQSSQQHPHMTMKDTLNSHI